MAFVMKRFRIILSSLVLTGTTTVIDAMDLVARAGPAIPLWTAERLDALRDVPYYFPANYEEDEATVYLALRRWDIIFTGDHLNTHRSVLDDENINRLIPGPFNHIMVYMGKDTRGLAYAVELNTSSYFDPGGLNMVCLGADFGLLRHPDHRDIQDRRYMTRRWAKRFREDSLAKILEADLELTSHLMSDFVMGFPYQLEFTHSGNLLDKYVYLVDDGFEGGSGCSDYWTTLFEMYAGVCLKNVRMTPVEFEIYFSTDPEGMNAYVPADLSPVAGQELKVLQFLNLGLRAVADEPHVFICDGSQESGLVLPSLIIESPLLEDIESLSLPFPLPWMLIRP